MKRIVLLLVMATAILLGGSFKTEGVRVTALNSYVKGNGFIDKYSLGGSLEVYFKAPERTNFYIGYICNTDTKKDVNLFKYGFNRSYGKWVPFVGFVVDWDHNVLRRGIGLDLGTSLKLYAKDKFEAGVSIEFISDISKLENTSIFQGLYVQYRF